MLPHKLSPNCEQLEKKKKTPVFREKTLCGHVPLNVPRPRMNFLSLGQGLRKMGEQQYPYHSGDTLPLLVTDNNNYSHRTTFKSFFLLHTVCVVTFKDKCL